MPSRMTWGMACITASRKPLSVASRGSPAAAARPDAFAGLATLLSSEDGGLGMHCDIVVGAESGQAQLVGGNVLDGVTMRLMPLISPFW